MGLNTGLIPSREQLLERLCGDFAHVRQKVLLTDDTHRTTAFYRACGWTEVGNTGCIAFIQ